MPAPTACPAQLVGFSMNPGRLTSTWTVRNRNGTPSTTWGNGSETIVSAAVLGLTAIAALTTSRPVPVSPASLNGPASAGTATLRPNGSPLYGPVRYTLPVR